MSFQEDSLGDSYNTNSQYDQMHRDTMKPKVHGAYYPVSTEPVRLMICVKCREVIKGRALILNGEPNHPECFINASR